MVEPIAEHPQTGRLKRSRIGWMPMAKSSNAPSASSVGMLDLPTVNYVSLDIDKFR